MTAAHTGGCLCGAVHYRVNGELRDVIACHCQQCRKTSGHFVAATAAAVGELEIDDGQGALGWYRSSDFARRGFCRDCGSRLFWKADDEDFISIMAGTLDGPTGLQTTRHIFVADRGDYYTLHDTIPCHARDVAGQEHD